MGRSTAALLSVLLAAAFLYSEASGFMIRNKLLGKCLQAQPGRPHGRVSTGDCSPDQPLQEWRWLAGSHALASERAGLCLTAPAEQYEGVRLQACATASGGDGAGLGGAEEDQEGVRKNNEHHHQAWSCSRRGHLTLQDRGVHLIATKDSALVFLSKEHKQHGNRWLTLDNRTVCSEREDIEHIEHRPQSPGGPLLLVVSPSAVPRVHNNNNNNTQPQQMGDVTAVDDDQKVSQPVPLSTSAKPPVDPTMVFFTMDYGMSWKITMLVLSSLALVLGTVILILNVHGNRRKKVVCVLKSYAPREEAASVPGS
ncbi:hypothetical protein CRUP_009946 [Coryphaenoides rupestris]|nr:hypothetical protein CRUP_009946 [Coryphaenoides rupestris]